MLLLISPRCELNVAKSLCFLLNQEFQLKKIPVIETTVSTIIWLYFTVLSELLVIHFTTYNMRQINPQELLIN